MGQEEIPLEESRPVNQTIRRAHQLPPAPQYYLSFDLGTIDKLQLSAVH